MRVTHKCSRSTRLVGVLCRRFLFVDSERAIARSLAAAFVAGPLELEALVDRAEVPGVDAEDVDISITGNTLTMRGEFQTEREEQRGTVHFRERRCGEFRRSVALPTEVKADKAEAEFANGVLTVTIPKAEEVKPKRIAVKVR